MAVLGVDARAAQLGHAAGQRRQRREVELGLAVPAADAPRRLRRQHAVGADDLASLRRVVLAAHDQVLAVRVEAVGIQAGRRAGRRRQPRAHLLREHLMAQALGLADLVGVSRPAHRQGGQGACLGRVLAGHDCGPGRRPRQATTSGQVGERQGGLGQIPHGRLSSW